MCLFTPLQGGGNYDDTTDKTISGDELSTDEDDVNDEGLREEMEEVEIQSCLINIFTAFYSLVFHCLPKLSVPDC